MGLPQHGELGMDVPLHAARAEPLRRAGDRAGAAEAYGQAIALSANAVERAELERRVALVVEARRGRTGPRPARRHEPAIAVAVGDHEHHAATVDALAARRAWGLLRAIRQPSGVRRVRREDLEALADRLTR
jgi:hypothetical protein